MYICLTCKSDQACLNHRAIKEDENFDLPCPTEGCSGVLLELDDGIAEAIVLLNEKGYVTIDSCGGHFNNCEDALSFYVGFLRGKAPPEDDLPESFVIYPGEKAGYQGDALYFMNTPEGAEDLNDAMQFKDGNRTLQILGVQKRFLEWVLTLPALVLKCERAGCDREATHDVIVAGVADGLVKVCEPCGVEEERDRHGLGLQPLPGPEA